MAGIILKSLVTAVAFAGLVSAAGAGELVRNGDFDAGMDSWWATSNLKPNAASGVLCVVVPGGLANPWDAIVGQDGIALRDGENYELSFAAAGDPSGPVRALVQMPQDPWTPYIEFKIDADQELLARSQRFTSTETREDGQLVFQLGGSAKAWTFCLDDVSVNSADAPSGAGVTTAVMVNQLGYLADGPKRATIVTDSPVPIDFDLVDAIGATVYSGATEPRGMDETAGVPVHTADFSSVPQTGEGFMLRAAGADSPPFAIAPGLYEGLRRDALDYFYLARSGIAIDARIAGEAYARPAGHVSSPDDGAANKGDRDVPCQTAEESEAVYGEAWTCDYKLGPVGGWYDAGDHGKYVVNGGLSVSQLMSAFEWASMKGGDVPQGLGDSTLAVPERGNGVPDILDEARWELDFIERMIVPDGEDLAGMVHHKIHDVRWTGLPLMPDQDEEPRELHRPSTAATLNAAAAFAQAARVFAPFDQDYADHARALAVKTWEAANGNEALYAPAADTEGGGAYDDDDVDDEFFWAASELYLTTGEDTYLDALRAAGMWDAVLNDPNGFDWRDVAAYAQLQLAMHAESLPDADASAITAAVTGHADLLLKRQNENPFGHAYVPEDGKYAWGSNHLVAQNATILAAAFELTGEDSYRNAAIESADYLFGRNALGQSYVTGYGTVYSQNQHSRWFAHQLDPALPHPPKGSMAGGPNSGLDDPVAQRQFPDGCPAQRCYVDDIESWSTNEITINWNAALAQFATWLAVQ